VSKKRDEINKLDLLALVHVIVPKLPVGWQVVEPRPDPDELSPSRTSLTSVRVRHASGAEFYVHRSTWPPELTIGARWPRAGDAPNGEEFRPSEGGPRISVSPWRDPGALAKDITRRFVVPFLPLWEKMAASRDEHARCSGEAHRLALTLAETLGENLLDYSNGWLIYAGRCNVCISRLGTVYFERLSTDDPARARAVVSLLASWSEPLCSGCGRPENECSAAPCDGVKADREAVMP